jgi:predicted nucleotidyltransferase
MSVTDAEIDRLRVALEARQEVAFAYLFGSGSSGSRHRLSDVDIAVFVYPHAREPRGELKTETDLWMDLWGVAERAASRGRNLQAFAYDLAAAEFLVDE